MVSMPSASPRRRSETELPAGMELQRSDVADNGAAKASADLDSLRECGAGSVLLVLLVALGKSRLALGQVAVGVRFGAGLGKQSGS